MSETATCVVLQQDVDALQPPSTQKHSNVSLSLLYNKTECHSSNRGTFPHNAPCSLTYWHNKILAAALWCSRCVRLCWYKAFLFFAIPLLKSCLLQEYIPPLYLSELSSFLSLPPPFPHYVKLLWHCSTWAPGVKIFLLNDKWTCG